ncbi:MAG: thiamine phosphate synthase [Gammaproteobacteria bacterium]|nr:thiamine phosphate synthase [Gammaproteobacteria bacterium]MCY4226484.1 thiamine phosphate synthase [Gammaproteobacteria bacterium]MCY4314364.1 thiamine phosphate synthase [Gammaproteobacteria bacterium]
MILDPFYPIFDSSAWMKRLVPLGIRQAQLRIKSDDLDLVRTEALDSMEICQRNNCRLFLNDHWQLAIELGCDAVHLGQEDLELANLSQISEAGISLGVSTHSKKELARALSTSPCYVAIGPIYPTILKKMLWLPQGLERITEWKSRAGSTPIVAIGGLNPERGIAALERGADCVSVVTDITLNSQPEQQVSHWLEITDPYRKSSFTGVQT